LLAKLNQFLITIHTETNMQNSRNDNLLRRSAGAQGNNKYN